MYSRVVGTPSRRVAICSVTRRLKASLPAPLPNDTSQDTVARLGHVQDRRQADHGRAGVGIADFVDQQARLDLLGLETQVFASLERETCALGW